LIFHIFGSLTEFERDLIRERTQAGLEAARAREKVGGRPKALRKGKAEMARRMYADKNNSVSEICKTLGIPRMTLWRYVRGGEREESSSLPPFLSYKRVKGEHHSAR
jgi:DNA invertase Pin-like site-specific DNA recombinase